MDPRNVFQASIYIFIIFSRHKFVGFLRILLETSRKLSFHVLILFCLYLATHRLICHCYSLARFKCLLHFLFAWCRLISHDFQLSAAQIIAIYRYFMLLFRLTDPSPRIFIFNNLRLLTSNLPDELQNHKYSVEGTHSWLSFSWKFSKAEGQFWMCRTFPNSPFHFHYLSMAPNGPKRTPFYRFLLPKMTTELLLCPQLWPKVNHYHYYKLVSSVVRH